MYEDEKTGYKRTPKRTRFKEGQSGNPRGRPPKKMSGTVLTPFVEIHIGGKAVRVPRAEAALFSMLSKGLQERDSAALSSFLHHWREIQPEKPRAEIIVRRVHNTHLSRNICDDLFEVLGAVAPVPPKRQINMQWFGLQTWLLEEALMRYDGNVFTEETISKIAEETVNPARAREILRHFVLTEASKKYLDRKTPDQIGPNILGASKIANKHFLKKDSRFRKGFSGNPKGRPRKRALQDVSLLNHLVPIEFEGAVQMVSPETAVLATMWAEGVAGNNRAMEAFYKNFRKYRDPEPEVPTVLYICRVPINDWRAHEALKLLNIMQNVEFRYEVSDWVIEEALKRNPAPDLSGHDLKSLSSVARNTPLAAMRLFLAQQKAAKLRSA